MGIFLNTVDIHPCHLFNIFLAAVHEAVAATMSQCRRLIIILYPEAKTLIPEEDREVEFLSEDSHQCFEQKIGLFEALTQNDPKVVLVELGEHIKILWQCKLDAFFYV